METNTLFLQPTATAQWQALIVEAEGACSVQLNQDLESYLVFLLMRFTQKPEMAASVLALEFLHAANYKGQHRQEALRDLGDKCLLFSGLFPGRAEKRRVRVSYFVELGKNSYATLATVAQQNIANLYTALCERFVPLMDILHAIRELAGNKSEINLLIAEELWQDTNSQHAFAVIQKHTQGLPIVQDPLRKKSSH